MVGPRRVRPWPCLLVRVSTVGWGVGSDGRSDVTAGGRAHILFLRGRVWVVQGAIAPEGKRREEGVHASSEGAGGAGAGAVSPAAAGGARVPGAPCLVLPCERG
ncbi:hypothetical protein B0H14DRAFT_2721762 [Mycena olivaceomarginata]|nr:hypothetical protein B0H14DRAFT_2721762 [Mycena olivaceomarginata]